MSQQLSVVATDAVPHAAEQAFARFGGIQVISDGRWAPLDTAEVLIVRGSRITETLLSHMPHLRVIARTGVGLDTIDVDAVCRRRIPLLYAPDSATRPVAEGTLALILATTKRLPELSSLVRDGRWEDRYTCEVGDLQGAVLGVIGLGRIGLEVAHLAQGLGMRVVACDPGYTVPDAQRLGPIGLADLAGVFACADIVTLHCPLNDSTRGMIDRRVLAAAKRGAILINASRGALIDGEEVLLEALDCGWLSGIGLDVFPSEPPAPGSRLLHHPRVIGTPHAVGLSRYWNRAVFTALADDVERVLNGLPPINVANPEVLPTTPSQSRAGNRRPSA
jgi:phosphoglycerate dehydrogenase-like enzyme